jgi:hypothetical protein
MIFDIIKPCKNITYFQKSMFHNFSYEFVVIFDLQIKSITKFLNN